jgi:Domain of unknown function (DUF4397)
MTGLVRRVFAVTAAGVLGVALSALTTAAAAAPVAAPAAARAAAVQPDDTSAVIRGAHFSPDTPGVDVYLTAFSGGTTTLWLTNVGYGDVSPYFRITPGLYAVSMRPHGAPASTPAALSWTLDAKAGSAYTACAVGMNSQLHGIVLHDELTPPKSGTGLVRVIQAADRAPRADLVGQNGSVIAKDAAFATSTDYTSVTAGTFPITARSTDSAGVQATSTIQVPSGSVSSIVVLDAKGSGIALRSVVDAAGAQITPIGAVNAGGGGTAATSDAGWIRGGIAVLGAVGVGLGVVGLRLVARRRSAAA